MMEKLTLVLAEAGLELVPPQLWQHPSVKSSARRRGKRPGEMLLDLSTHWHAMKSLQDREKRGRPDIAHFCMLLVQNSLLNRRGFVRLYVHTYSGRVIGVAPTARPPRNYNRFVGLMEQLLVRGRVPPDAEEPLLWVEGKTLGEVLSSVKPTGVYLLDEGGSYVKPTDLAEELASQERPVVIIGCFQAGMFSQDTRRLAERVVSIAAEPLDACIVTCKILSLMEAVLGL